MSGPPRVRSMNIADSDSRPVLGPAGNKTRPTETGKTTSKPAKKSEKALRDSDVKHKKSIASSPPISVPNSPQRETALFALRRQHSRTASCSSDASSSTSDTPSLSGRVGARRKQCGLKMEKVGKVERLAGVAGCLMVDSIGCLESKKRCAWVTPKTGRFMLLFF